MSADRWTAEDVKRGADALFEYMAKRDTLVDHHRESYREPVAAVLAALADSRQPAPTGSEPDLWQYGMHDETADDILPLEGTPRYISPRWFRRPMRAVGPWLPVQPEETKP